MLGNLFELHLSNGKNIFFRASAWNLALLKMNFQYFLFSLATDKVDQGGLQVLQLKIAELLLRS